MNATSTAMIDQTISSTMAITNEILPSILQFSLIILLAFWVLGIALTTWRYGIYKMSGIKKY